MNTTFRKASRLSHQPVAKKNDSIKQTVSSRYGKHYHYNDKDQTEATEDCTESSWSENGVDYIIQEVPSHHVTPYTYTYTYAENQQQQAKKTGVNRYLERLRQRTAKPPLVKIVDVPTTTAAATTTTTTTPITSDNSSSDNISPSDDDDEELEDDFSVKSAVHQEEEEPFVVDVDSSKINRQFAKQLQAKLRLIEDQRQDELHAIELWKRQQKQAIDKQARASHLQVETTCSEVSQREELAHAAINALKAANKKLRQGNERMRQGMIEYSRENNALEENIANLKEKIKKVQQQVKEAEFAHDKIANVEQQFRERRDQYEESYRQGADLLAQEHEAVLRYWKALSDIMNNARIRYAELLERGNRDELAADTLVWIQYIRKTTRTTLHKDPIADRDDQRYVLDRQQQQRQQQRHHHDCHNS